MVRPLKTTPKLTPKLNPPELIDAESPDPTGHTQGGAHAQSSPHSPSTSSLNTAGTSPLPPFVTAENIRGCINSAKRSLRLLLPKILACVNSFKCKTVSADFFRRSQNSVLYMIHTANQPNLHMWKTPHILLQTNHIQTLNATP